MAKTEIIHGQEHVSKPKQTRTPKDYNAIENGALKLSLEDMVNLRNNLTVKIDATLKKMEDDYNAAKSLLTAKN